MPSQKKIIAQNLAQTNAAIAESEKSPYNEAQISKQNQDYYNKVLGEYARAQREASFGLSPEETAAARQNYAETTNLARQNAITAGGGTLGRYINANLNANQGQFATQLAAQDAEVKRQKQAMVASYLNELGGASQRFQDVQNLNFQKQMMAEQALGQAKSDWQKAELQRKQQNKEAWLSLVGMGAQAGSAYAGTEAGAAALAALSDIRLKQDIVFSHEENGYKVYEFSYKSEPSIRYSGVMAQEVMMIKPEAVFEENGYYKVNYDMLGITMKKLN